VHHGVDAVALEDSRHRGRVADVGALEHRHLAASACSRSSTSGELLEKSSTPHHLEAGAAAGQPGVRAM
jgi:hypothetical protein